MYVENRTKIANFPTPVYLTPPLKGFPLEFGIGVRGPECYYDGAIRWSKKFSDTFSRFDTIPAVTDSRPAALPPSHPASHVAVAITLNAKASSLKTGSPRKAALRLCQFRRTLAYKPLRSRRRFTIFFLNAVFSLYLWSC